MKFLHGISLLFGLFYLVSLSAWAKDLPAQATDLPARATDLPICPVESEKETALDCPWAGIARDLQSVPEKQVPKRMKSAAPELVKRLVAEGKVSGEMQKLWGRSINFDEGAKAVIVPPPVIDAIFSYAKVTPRKDRIVHAGFEHTYGYLLSNLQTPYGYKRLRWVRPDIENGFGLRYLTLSPFPKEGGFFMNVSAFIGRIAFRGENPQEQRARKIIALARGVSPTLRHFSYHEVRGRRLTETVSLPSGREIELRTDFVPFTVADADTGGNTELLIYSVRDSAEKLPQLITAFPIAKGFSDGALNPANLGDGKPITTRYNAFVPGLTDSKVPLAGKRAFSEF